MLQVTSPRTRASVAQLPDQVAREPEAGKFFHLTYGGESDPDVPSDVVNGTPPVDGKIASAGNPKAAVLDAAGTQWEKKDVRPGAPLSVTWECVHRPKVRRWVYFLTKQGWDPAKPLARAQFEAQPFYKVENLQQPFWDVAGLEASSPTVHEVLLPSREGYHVLLAVAEMADTGMAFYQVIDLSFA